MKQADSKFIVEVSHPYLTEQTFIRKIGGQAWSITFTNDIYQARPFDNEKTAIKTAERVKKYINEAYERGWDTYARGWDDKKCHATNILKDIEATVREVRLTIIR